jgi:TusE/DsrC/DsvC family sulfur relay protein
MLDINQAIAAAERSTNGMPCSLDELEPWSEDVARGVAAKEGINLTPEHWEVVCFMREHYEECGLAHSGRTLLRCLEEEFAEQGGGKYLYRLFPGGPVSQGSRIAGLPLPAYSSDKSFGSVE